MKKETISSESTNTAVIQMTKHLLQILGGGGGGLELG